MDNTSLQQVILTVDWFTVLNLYKINCPWTLTHNTKLVETYNLFFLNIVTTNIQSYMVWIHNDHNYIGILSYMGETTYKCRADKLRKPSNGIHKLKLYVYEIELAHMNPHTYRMIFIDIYWFEHKYRVCLIRYLK